MEVRKAFSKSPKRALATSSPPFFSPRRFRPFVLRFFDPPLWLRRPLLLPLWQSRSPLSSTLLVHRSRSRIFARVFPHKPPFPLVSRAFIFHTHAPTVTYAHQLAAMLSEERAMPTKVDLPTSKTLISTCSFLTLCTPHTCPRMHPLSTRALLLFDTYPSPPLVLCTHAAFPLRFTGARARCAPLPSVTLWLLYRSVRWLHDKIRTTPHIAHSSRRHFVV